MASTKGYKTISGIAEFFVPLQESLHSDNFLYKSKREISLSCCGYRSHCYEEFEVERKWRLHQLRCLIVGENPSGEGQPYFYEEPINYDNDSVIVRRSLLQNLYEREILDSATLTGFREAGFLFDHAIRCRMSKDEVKKERQRAQQYKSERVQNPRHLLPTVRKAPIVWVMGHVASNAMANLDPAFPKEKRRISCDPFACPVPGSRYFLSEYLTRWNKHKWPEIFAAFLTFARTKDVFGQ